MKNQQIMVDGEMYKITIPSTIKNQGESGIIEVIDKYKSTIKLKGKVEISVNDNKYEKITIEKITPEINLESKWEL